MRANKYTYLKVIQQSYGQGWEDVSEYETTSIGTPKEFDNKISISKSGKEIILYLIHADLKEYKLLGYPTRVIRRKELKNA